MAYTVTPGTIRTERVAHPHAHSGPVYQAYQILHIGFSVAPLIAGLDKFFYYLADWTKYLSPTVQQYSPVDAITTMKIVGAIEIVAGFLVAFRPKIGAYIVAVWLLGIIINLLLIPGYFDIALRDVGLCLGALALGRLSEEYDHHL
jgi:hypothetical protein